MMKQKRTATVEDRLPHDKFCTCRECCLKFNQVDTPVEEPNVEDTSVVPDAKLKQRIEDLQTAGEAYRVIWSQVEQAKAAIEIAYRLASDLSGELGTALQEDAFAHELYAISNKLADRRSDLGFFEQKVQQLGFTFRRNARQLKGMLEEDSGLVPLWGKYLAMMEAPDKDKK